jgi:hypothetical protein
VAKDPAAPPSAVKVDQTRIALAIIDSANTLRNACKRDSKQAIKHSEIEATQSPSCMSEISRSVFMAWPIVEMMVRSIKLKVKA